MQSWIIDGHHGGELERERKLDFRAPQQGAKLPTIGVWARTRVQSIANGLRLWCSACANSPPSKSLAMDFAMIQPKLSQYCLIGLKEGKGLNCFSHASLLLL
jgi:hypothetical protein